MARKATSTPTNGSSSSTPTPVTPNNTNKKKASNVAVTQTSSSTTTPSPLVSYRFAIVYMLAPYLIGLIITKYSDVFASWWKQPSFVKPGSTERQHRQTTTSSANPHRPDQPLLQSQQDIDNCHKALLKQLIPKGQRLEAAFENLSIVLHRNGESNSCGAFAEGDIVKDLYAILATLDTSCPKWDNKYEIESFLTRYIHSKVAASTCHSLESDRLPTQGLYGFCDMGEDRTPILLDHGKLIPIRDTTTNETYLPCHFHNSHGVRINSLSTLFHNALHTTTSEPNCSADNDNNQECRSDLEANATTEHDPGQQRQLHLYAVPAGRVFMFAPTRVGQIIHLPHVQGADPTLPVYLKVLSLEPKVFDLFNFFTRDESTTLINTALKEHRDDYRIKRSSTGNTGYRVNPQRTSESGFDTSSKTALQLKRRCFDVLGYDEYIESHSDGLQMLRYNLSTSYIAHMDYMDLDDSLPHDYDSSHKGGNRYATILLYMTDLGENDGGETVFTEAWPVGQSEQDRIPFETALEQVREAGAVSMFAKDSWQEHMVAKCRSRLAVRPYAGRAVLFYSQHPNGTADKSSLHGGCPVLSGTKYAANLWVWNTPRAGFAGHPKNPKFKDDVDETGFVKKTALFVNTKQNPEFQDAELYYEDQFWSKLGFKDPESFVNTYDGHIWNIRAKGKVVKSWTIEGSKKEFVFKI